MEQFACPPAPDPAPTQGNFAVFFGDRRQVEMLPAPLLEEVTGEVTLVYTLLNKDDRAGHRIVQAAQKR
jgi:hypothetical protein